MIRVFPRRTKWTPDDDLAFVGDPPLFRPPEQPVSISVAFTWDLEEADRLFWAWRQYYSDVSIGGPATGEKESEFVPGRFLKNGAVITSRGCRNQCWFCEVWKRNGEIHELPIMSGWNVMDDNLLQCSEQHIRTVFNMLRGQSQRIKFSGGLEAARLQDWHIDLLLSIRLDELFFAYDTEDDYEPLVIASQKMKQAGFIQKNHTKRVFAFCLIGFDGDTQAKAEERLMKIVRLGITPMAMLWRDQEGKKDPKWGAFQRLWARPWNIYGQIKSKNLK